MSLLPPGTASQSYRGRIAPTPTGLLHLGHAATFWRAQERARLAGGRVVLRMDDLDPLRCREEFSQAALQDLGWLGLKWDEGPVYQSHRRSGYFDIWRRLREGGWIYPCSRSRKDVAAASMAPHEEEPIFPVEWRVASDALKWGEPGGVNWRFRVPDGETIFFEDENLGPIQRTALRDFGDFVIWNREDVPAYELAVVTDDIALQITEVVRGADLVTSTARQLLIYRALEASPPRFYHAPLMLDETGRRLAKRDGALSIKALRDSGWKPEDVIAQALSKIA